MNTATSELQAPAWRRQAGLLTGLLVLLPLLLHGLRLTPELPGVLALSPLLRFDALSLPMLLVTGAIGAVILRYARTYLAGEPVQSSFTAWFLAALASVSVLVVSNHLLLLVAARIAGSVCLHRLLTTFPERPRAQLAAHKTFLSSRVADLCLLGAAWLLWEQYGSLRFDTLFAAHAASAGALAGGVQVALLLLASAALLLCAQLPAHGWLMQVMEAPTPVSALLHAGLINVGGFLMIRCAPLMADAAAAQGLLVVVGGLTAAIASLVLLTRVSVKVALAWSTCAQMGFMLVECGLGLWSLALLHLLAHSLYKARAFLASGDAVRGQMRRDDAPVDRPPLPWHWTASCWLVLAAGVAAHQLGLVLLPAGPQGLALAVILGSALVPLLAEAQATDRPRAWARLAVAALCLLALHTGWHHLTIGLLAPLAPDQSGPWWSAGFVALLFGALLVVHANLRSLPDGALSRRLYPLFYGGLFLDELSTRFTLWVWPRQLLRLALRRPRLGGARPHRGVHTS